MMNYTQNPKMEVNNNNKKIINNNKMRKNKQTNKPHRHLCIDKYELVFFLIRNCEKFSRKNVDKHSLLNYDYHDFSKHTFNRRHFAVLQKYDEMKSHTYTNTLQSANFRCSNLFVMAPTAAKQEEEEEHTERQYIIRPADH